MAVIRSSDGTFDVTGHPHLVDLVRATNVSGESEGLARQNWRKTFGVQSGAWKNCMTLP